MTHRTLHTLVILPLLLLIVTSAQAGKVYKWTDANGEVHYSQTPPPDEHAKEMNVDVKEPKPHAGSSTQAKKPDAAQQKDGKNPATDAAKRAEREKKNEEIRQENCKRANKRFRTINAGGRLYDVNEKGERVYWDDNKRNSELADAQKSVEKWCNQ